MPEQAAMQHYGDNFTIVIPVDEVIHTAKYPFCANDPSCICHTDPENVAPVEQSYHDGLITQHEMTTIIMGKR